MADIIVQHGQSLAALPLISQAAEQKLQELDVLKMDSIISFGTSAQGELQAISQEMLKDVKNKSAGPAGESLQRMVSTLRGFNDEPIDARESRTLWERITGKLAPAARFMAKQETVREQISMITEELLQHEAKLMKDIKSLDILYAKARDFYDQIGLYIEAATYRIAEIDMIVVPAAEQDLASAPEAEKMIKAQGLRDLRSARDDLERRLHDLKLTRQVTMQSIPSIRMVQENDKSLVVKINSTLTNTIPLWETQLAQAITVQRSREAAEALRGAGDLTNELLARNADNLREANTIVRQEMERGVFDIDAVKRANVQLIETINDSLRITDEGKLRREAAELELQKMEGELRDALASARARQDAGKVQSFGVTV